MKKETTIPFMGFYNSIHDAELDRALEQMTSNDQGTINDVLHDRAFSSIDWQAVHLAYAKKYAESFAKHFNIALTFKLLTSPKYYNYETDRIFCEIELDEIARLYTKIDKTALQEKIVKRFTSGPGFLSHYPNDLKEWPKDLETWDHNQIGTLIECYIEATEPFDADVEYDLIEGFNGNGYIDNWICESIKDDRILNVAYYLRTREERHI